MTVKELRERLGKVENQDSRVVISLLGEDDPIGLVDIAVFDVLVEDNQNNGWVTRRRN